MNSMTGFGQAVAESASRRIEVAIQGWNHRHLDVVLRLPEEVRGRESELRSRLAARVGRGRCEVVVRVHAVGESPRRRVAIDAAAVETLHAGAAGLVARGLIQPELSLGDLVRASAGWVSVEAAIPEWSEPDSAALETAFAASLDAFAASRTAEGGKLAAVLERIRGDLTDLVAALGERRGAAAERIETALRARLAELLGDGSTGLAPERIEQEVVMLVDRGDVREELDRLSVHVDHFALVAGRDEPVGKRLEFLTQELLRELNTIGSKSRDVEMTRLVVDGKVLCEQIREQLQNVE